MRCISKLCLTVSVLCSRIVLAGEYFDPGLLQSANGNTVINDTSLLSQGYQPPGTYRVQINVNGKPSLVSDVRFELNDKKDLIPCLSFQTYQKLGVDLNKITSKTEDNSVKNSCVDMQEQLPGTKADFDFSKLTLDISIPQTVMRDESLSGVPEEEWDDGIPALISMYQLSGQQYIQSTSGTQDSVFANLTNGFNIGRWRYRNNATLSNSDGWKSISNYVETAVRSLKGELTVGDADTPGDIFDSLMIRGIQLNSDDDMLPDQLTGFAPLIRGIAKSNAQVTVRNNGNIIYQRSVPPGPFVIQDLSSVSNGGKLDVTITEADGSETHSTVSYSNVPQLLRAHQIKYSLAAGRYLSNANSVEDTPELLQAALSWGLPFDITTYGGIQYQEKYKALSLGIGFDLQRAGGVAIDVTESQGQRGNSPEYTGDMLRLTYRNSIPETGTQIQLDNRYYRRNYLSFSDWADTETLFEDSRLKREYNLTINQSITDQHSFFTTLTRTVNQDSTVSRSWQLGWNGSWEMVSFSLAWSMTRNEGAPEWDKQLALTLSVPMGDLFPSTQPMLNYTATTGLKGDLSNQVGVSGRIGNRQDLNWNTQVSYDTQNGESDTQSGSAGIDYQGNHGEFNVTYNADKNQYISWNASGNILAHKGGITLGRFSSGSQALISIPGAENVELGSNQNIKTDSRGFAIVPDLQSYHRNALSVDPQTNKEVDFVSTSAEVIPTKDAVTLASFKAISGRKVVMTVNYKGEPLPFGARVRVEGNEDTWYVGDQGQAYLNSAPDEGTVNFTWGDKQHCSAPFAIPAKKSVKLAVALLNVECH
ncbi:fimbria/pilus outer membrane usher protein [Citrobacter farmeri]|uniref:Fimbrial assembly protein n=1 Tax=Citrobacter amalonaticus Y19 TaxID=1261127 RepID=A0A0F6RGX1_CITAM|nr:fimbria/pilus outer membrane usher protein [Citrobacter amalonaticus]AKE60650.1 fimbrial assembly protein [Citrobacter amalonaticus Y19]EKV5655549.1 fimbrial biogenesis outer membrane usher protein [Citrobacter farmeri]